MSITPDNAPTTTTYEDIDCILNLQKMGPVFLETLYKLSNDKIHTGYVNRLEKLYLFDGDLYENSIPGFVDYIIKIDKLNTVVWDNFMNGGNKIITNREIIKLFDKFGNYILDTNNEDSINFYQKLLASSKIEKLLLAPDNYELWDQTFGIILKTANISDFNYSSKMTQITDMIKYYISKPHVKTKFINWISHILNKSIPKLNMDIYNIDTTSPPDDYLANILCLLFKLSESVFGLDSTITPVPVPVNNLIDFDYITSPVCKMKWFDHKPDIMPKEYTDATIYFFMILNTIRIGYIPALYRSNEWRSIIDNIPNILGEYFAGHKNKINEYVALDTLVTKQNDIADYIFRFYLKFNNLFATSNLKSLDDIYYDMAYFFTNTPIDMNIYLNVRMHNFILDMIGTNLYTNNIGLKTDYIKLFQKIAVTKKIYEIDDEISRKYLYCLITLYNQIHDAQIRAEFKLNKKMVLLGIINMYMENSALTMNSYLGFIEVITQDTYILKKFINIYLMDIIEYTEAVNDEYPGVIRGTRRNKVQTAKMVSGILNLIIGSIHFLDKLIEICLLNVKSKSIMFSEEIFKTIITVTHCNMKMVTNVIKFSDDKIGAVYVKSLGTNEYISSLTKIINMLYQNINNIEFFVNDNLFDFDAYTKIHLYSNKLFDIYTDISKHREHAANMALVGNNPDDNNNSLEVPDEFIDPITCYPIDDPCLLPDMTGDLDNTFFERSTIMKQLLIKEENPYTRSVLTMRDFEEYNELDSVKQKNQEFKNRFDEWKLANLKAK